MGTEGVQLKCWLLLRKKKFDGCKISNQVVLKCGHQYTDQIKYFTMNQFLQFGQMGREVIPQSHQVTKSILKTTSNRHTHHAISAVHFGFERSVFKWNFSGELFQKSFIYIRTVQNRNGRAWFTSVIKLFTETDVKLGIILVKVGSLCWYYTGRRRHSFQFS